jgi:hypothetical protein
MDHFSEPRITCGSPYEQGLEGKSGTEHRRTIGKVIGDIFETEEHIGIFIAIADPTEGSKDEVRMPRNRQTRLVSSGIILSNKFSVLKCEPIKRNAMLSKIER